MCYPILPATPHGNIITHNVDSLNVLLPYTNSRPTTDCGDNEQDNSSETTDEDDEELLPLRSEVELAVKQLKNGKTTGCDDISA